MRGRTVTTFKAIDYIMFVDGSLLESELFHNGREAEHPKAIEARSNSFWMAVGSRSQYLLSESRTDQMAHCRPRHPSAHRNSNTGVCSRWIRPSNRERRNSNSS